MVKNNSGWLFWWNHVKNSPKALRLLLTGIIALTVLFSAGEREVWVMGIRLGWQGLEVILISLLVVAGYSLYWCVKWFRWTSATGILLAASYVLWLLFRIGREQTPPLEVGHLVVCAGAALVLVQLSTSRPKSVRSVQLGASWTRE